MSRYDYSIISIEQRKLNEEELNNEPLQYRMEVEKVLLSPPLIAKKKVK